MFGTRKHRWGLCYGDGRLIIFENLAFDNRGDGSKMKDRQKFVDEIDEGDDVSKRLTKSDILRFGGAKCNLSL